MTTTFETVTSADGTRIAFERTGDGPPVILVGGAFNDRSTVAGLAAALAPDLTAIAYDRRGRGGSGDSDRSKDRGAGEDSDSSGDSGNGGGGDSGSSGESRNSHRHTVDREIDDLAALIEYAGGSASLFGHSSGAILALEAAHRGLPIARLAVYEPPYVVDGSRARPGVDLVDRLRALIDEGRRDDAVTLFLTEGAAVPPEMVREMQASQVWGWFTGLAHTLPYDAAVCGPGNALPADRLATITAPTLAIGGSLSPPWLPAAAHAVAVAVAVADTIPGARYITLDGQDHGVLNQPDALRPVLLDFLT